MAVSWIFVAVLTLLTCGFCGADTEFSILEEAQVLAVQMKKLSSQELGVFNMQVSATCYITFNMQVSATCYITFPHRMVFFCALKRFD